MSNPAPDAPRRVTQLATEALNAELRGDTTRAARAVKAISDEAGGEGLSYAVTGWCDTLILYYRRSTGTPDNAPIRPGWVNADTGEKQTDADDVPAEARWAGRLIAARAALDHPAYGALLASLPEDGQSVGDHVLMLLTMVSMTLRKMLAGAP